MSIKCLAIDDEPLALQQISSYIGKIPYLELVRACAGPTEAMEVLATTPVDVIFSDIEMPDVNGLDYVRSLKNKPLIVFVTAYPNFAIEGFKADAIDYLLKPFGLSDFLRTAEKVKQQYELLQAAQTRDKSDGAEEGAPSAIPDIPAGNEYIFVRSESKTVRLRVPDIQYIESRKEYVVVFSENSIPVMTLFSLKAMEERLPGTMFMRVHRSFIVNLKKIKEVVQNRIMFSDDVYVPIGDQYREEFQQFLAKHFWK